MKVLYAIYDKDDNFIDCGFSLEQLGINNSKTISWRYKSKYRKLYRIPLEKQDDIFLEEDEAFIEEFSRQVFTNVEYAKYLGISLKTFYRLKAKKGGRKL